MINNESLAPIVLFTYNRLWHTKQTIEALQRNILAQESELFIYSDGAGNNCSAEAVNSVREYIRSINGFKKVTVIERQRNLGLADSIIDGVTEIVKRYGKVIVLEDDIVTNEYFLTFMNNALKKYSSQKVVWHISGWNYPMNVNGLDDIFFWRLMNCWGWATWSDRWQYYDKNINSIIQKFSREDIDKFNLDGVENFYAQILNNKSQKISTWAIFWYATIFKKNGLCLNPKRTLVENIGNDNSGTNCNLTDMYTSSFLDKHLPNIESNIAIRENEIAVRHLKDFYRRNNPSLLKRLLRKLKSLVI